MTYLISLTTEQIGTLASFAEDARGGSDPTCGEENSSQLGDGDIPSYREPNFWEGALYGALRMLSSNQMRELLALMLLGRGDDCEPGDVIEDLWDRLRRTAPVERDLRGTIGYLMGKSNLAGYLRTGLDRLSMQVFEGDSLEGDRDDEYEE